MKKRKQYVLKRSHAKIYRNLPTPSMRRYSSTFTEASIQGTITAGLTIGTSSVTSTLIVGDSSSELYSSFASGDNWAKLTLNVNYTLTNLNNFPISVDMFQVRPRFDFTNTGSSTIMDALDAYWTLNGGSSGQWSSTSSAPFDPRAIPGVANGFKIVYKGRTFFKPMDELVMLNITNTQVTTRARAYLMSGGTGLSPTTQISRGQQFYIFRYLLPIVSGATSSGRANPATVITRSMFRESLIIGRGSLSASTSIDNPWAVAAQTIFHKQNVTTGAAVVGNVTI